MTIKDFLPYSGSTYMEKENSKTGVPVYGDAPKTQMGRRIFKLSDEMEVYFRETQARIAEERLRGGNSYDHTWDGFISVKPDGNIIPGQGRQRFQIFSQTAQFPYYKISCPAAHKCNAPL